MKETRTQHWRRRSAELNKQTKAGLCARYREMGGMGGVHPPEKWRKDEVITSIVDMEWDRLPEDRKLPDPPIFDPPCDTCGKGPEAHPHGHDHHYAYTAGASPEDAWVCRRCGLVPMTHVGNRCLTAEDQDQDGPPCGRCGHSPAEHLGWNRGHLWIRSMHHQTPAEVQHPQGAEATATLRDPYDPALCDCPDDYEYHRQECPEYEATPAPRTFEVVMSSSGHIDDPYLPCRGTECDGECNISEKDCPGYRPGFPLDHHTATPRAHLDGCSADEDPDGETMCVCASIAAEPKPDPREDEECTPELIDGRYYGCGVCEACNAVHPQ